MIPMTPKLQAALERLDAQAKAGETCNSITVGAILAAYRAAPQGEGKWEAKCDPPTDDSGWYIVNERAGEILANCLDQRTAAAYAEALNLADSWLEETR